MDEHEKEWGGNSFVLISRGNKGINGRNEERVRVFVSLLYEKVCESLRKSGWDERVNGNTQRESAFPFPFSFSFFFLFSCYSRKESMRNRHTYTYTGIRIRRSIVISCT